MYTPGFVLNGEEWRGWGGCGSTADFAKPAKAAAGVLEVVAVGTNQFSVTYTPPAGTDGDVEATVAWLGSNLVSDVRRGENAGRNLKHRFVVLRLATGKLSPKESAVTAILALAAPERRDAEKLALAAWVLRRGEPSPLQAVGGWWPN